MPLSDNEKRFELRKTNYGKTQSTNIKTHLEFW